MTNTPRPLLTTDYTEDTKNLLTTEDTDDTESFLTTEGESKVLCELREPAGSYHTIDTLIFVPLVVNKFSVSSVQSVVKKDSVPSVSSVVKTQSLRLSLNS